jgi:TPR repeat protein
MPEIKKTQFLFMTPNSYTDFKKEADAGNSHSQHIIAHLHCTGEKQTPIDLKQAEFWYGEAFKNGRVHAKKDLGEVLRENGDVAGAILNFTDAAIAGNSKAALALGQIHEQGLGGPVNKTEAYAWYDLAADDGDLEAEAAITALQPTVTDTLEGKNRKALLKQKRIEFFNNSVLP